MWCCHNLKLLRLDTKRTHNIRTKVTGGWRCRSKCLERLCEVVINIKIGIEHTMVDSPTPSKAYGWGVPIGSKAPEIGGKSISKVSPRSISWVPGVAFEVVEARFKFRSKSEPGFVSESVSEFEAKVVSESSWGIFAYTPTQSAVAAIISNQSAPVPDKSDVLVLCSSLSLYRQLVRSKIN